MGALAEVCSEVLCRLWNFSVLNKIPNRRRRSGGKIFISQKPICPKSDPETPAGIQPAPKVEVT